MDKRKKILLFANTDWYLYNFRQPLAERLRDDGYEVVLVSPESAYGPKLRELGFRWIPFEFSTRSVNPLRELTVLWRLYRLFRRERPQIVHNFTIKCVLYGSFVSQVLGGTRILNSITGLGHIFTDHGIKARIIRPIVRLLYRIVLSNNNVRVIFENAEDRDIFVNDGLVHKSVARLIRGAGVNCEVFHPVGPLCRPENTPIRVLFAARLIKEKGIMELLDAARMIKAKGLNVEFVLAGDVYPANPTSLTTEELRAIEDEGVVRYFGHVDDMAGLIANCDIVVLPTYREGTPSILLEAAASAKPIVATKVAGCIGVVKNWVNGLLVPVKDSNALAHAIETIATRDDLRDRFGRLSRRIALTKFEETIVVNKTVEIIEELSPRETGLPMTPAR